MFFKYLISLFFLTGQGVQTLLLAPVNVSVESVNLQSELYWNPGTTDEDVQYTVQYRVNRELFHSSNNGASDHDDWLEIPECSATRARQCNLTPAIDVFINATLRVRAHNGKLISPWSQSRPFKAVDQSLLGPPSVTLWTTPETGWLHVRIRDSFDRKHFSNDLKYRLYYKKEDNNWMIYNDTLSLVLIDKFEVGFNYCVKVHYVWYSKLRPNSVPSMPKCAFISESESAKTIRIMWVTALIVFLVVGLLLMCIYLFTKNYDYLKQALQPPLQLPEHLHEFLSGEEQFVQLPEGKTSSSSSEEDSFDKVSLVTINKEAAAEELNLRLGHPHPST